MGFSFDFDKLGKRDPRAYAELGDDEFDYEFADDYDFNLEDDFEYEEDDFLS